MKRPHEKFELKGIVPPLVTPLNESFELEIASCLDKIQIPGDIKVNS